MQFFSLSFLVNREIVEHSIGIQKRKQKWFDVIEV